MRLPEIKARYFGDENNNFELNFGSIIKRQSLKTERVLINYFNFITLWQLSRSLRCKVKQSEI